MKLLRNSLLIWIGLSVLLAFISYLGGKDGGSAEYPVFLTNEERANPILLFWKMLPGCMLISGVITGIGAAIAYVRAKKK